MSRRRPTPWIHRWSRFLIAGVALLGALLTGYLTLSHQLGKGVACPTSGCDIVLTSPYASLFGLPLSLFGMLGYLGMLALALGPYLVNGTTQKEQRKQVEELSWLLLFAGAIAMVIFSGYLMVVLATQLKVACLYCIASAIFTVTLLVLTLLGRAWQDIGKLLFIGLIVGMFTLIGSLGMYSAVSRAQNPTPENPAEISLLPVGEPTPGVGWPITTTSGESELQLAKHLTDIGAKMYVSWTCPHCHEQKQLLGKQAYAEIKHIECNPSGVNAQPALCEAAKVTGVPTWEIKDKMYSGAQPLRKLADLSGYTGPRNFKNFPEAFQGR